MINYFDRFKLSRCIVILILFWPWITIEVSNDRLGVSYFDWPYVQPSSDYR